MEHGNSKSNLILTLITIIIIHVSLAFYAFGSERHNPLANTSCIHKLPSLNLSPEIGYLDNGFGFPQPLQADARTVNEIRPKCFFPHLQIQDLSLSLKTT
jgi:hypothetical protein